MTLFLAVPDGGVNTSETRCLGFDCYGLRSLFNHDAMSTPDSEAKPSTALATFGQRTFVASVALGLATGLALIPLSYSQYASILAIGFAIYCGALAARRAKDAEARTAALEATLWQQKLADRGSHHALIERAVTGFYRSTREGQFLIANRGLANIFGYDSGEQLKAHMSNIARLYVDPQRREEFHVLMRADQAVRDFVSQARRRDGSTIWIAENALAVLDHDGTLLYYEGTIEDVTARRSSEDATLRILREARDAARSKAAFLAAVSHELKTPLNAVIGFADVIRKEMFGPVGNERYRDYIEDIHENGRRLLTKINDILDLTRLEGHLMELEDETIRVPDAIDNARNAVTDGKTLSVEFAMQIQADLPGLRADAKRLHQILFQVISNAVKFTAAGGRIDLQAKLEPDGGIGISVRDSGIGMRPELVKQAMQPFRQLDARLERNFEGLGLGLPLANALLRLHGGQFSMESAIGVGSTVSLHFPPDRTVRPLKLTAA